MQIKINGNYYRKWTELIVDLSFDKAASTFSITSVFDPSDKEQRELLRPLAYNEVIIYSNDNEKLLTGTILNHTSTSSAIPNQITMMGYSTCGVLIDCEIPEEAYPLQDTGKTLKDITEKLIAPFGVELFVNQIATEDANKVIEKSSATAGGSVASYITTLASQFNIVVGNTRNGRLLFTRNRLTEAPQSNYKLGESSKYIKGSIDVNGRNLHSRYTVKRQSTISFSPTTENAEVSLSNPIVNSFRPRTKVQTSGTEDTTDSATKALRASELGNISFGIDVQGHNYDNGAIIKPNRVITVQDENIFLYNQTKLFVRGVTLKSNAVEDSAKLKCVLLEALTGSTVNSKIFKS